MATLEALARLVSGTLHGDVDASLDIEGIMPLEYAGPTHISFFANPKYLAQAKQSQAAALIAQAPFDESPRVLIVHDNPYLAAAKLAAFFHPPPKRPGQVHPSAVVDSTAHIGAGVYIGPQAVIEAGASIADGAQIHALCFVGENASVGRDAILYPRATLMMGCQVGDRCILQPGVVIGSDGFGFAEDKGAPDGHVRIKVPQLGIVVLGDDVEIGANTTIDRATFGATMIGNGSKIDNLVQIGHNVRTGEDCVIVAQAGISGSTKLHKRVIVGGQAGIVGHISIGSNVMIQAQSGINKSLKDGEIVGGSPSLPYKEWVRQQMTLRHIDALRKRVYGIKSGNEQ